jgi:hypothetical protein
MGIEPRVGYRLSRALNVSATIVICTIIFPETKLTTGDCSPKSKHLKNGLNSLVKRTREPDGGLPLHDPDSLDDAVLHNVLNLPGHGREGISGKSGRKTPNDELSIKHSMVGVLIQYSFLLKLN